MWPQVRVGTAGGVTGAVISRLLAAVLHSQPPPDAVPHHFASAAEEVCRCVWEEAALGSLSRGAVWLLVAFLLGLATGPALDTCYLVRRAWRRAVWVAEASLSEEPPRRPRGLPDYATGHR